MQGGIVQVLAVEDNPATFETIKAILEASKLNPSSITSFQIHHCTSLEAVQHWLAVPKHQPDVILLDLSLPDSNGFATFQAVYDLANHIPVVILTGSNALSLALKAIRSGAQDYLFKSELSNGYLPRTLRYAIERQRLLQRTQELEQTESLFYALTRNLPDSAVLLFDTDLRCMLAAGKRLDGLTLNPAEIQSKALSEFMAEEQAANLKPALQAALKGKEVVQEIHYRNHFFYTHIFPVKNLQNTVVASMIIAQDITERYERDKQREHSSLVVERMGRDINLSVTSRAYGTSEQPTQLSQVDDYVHRYRQILDKALEQAAFNVNYDLSEELRRMADELGVLQATPRQLVEIHQTALKTYPEDTPPRKIKAAIDEGRILLLELLGYLASFYRGTTASDSKHRSTGKYSNWK